MAHRRATSDTQPPPVRSAAAAFADRCLGMRARRIARLSSRMYDEELRPHGIGIAQMNLLVALGASGGLSPTDLGAILDIEKSTLSRTLRTLETEGLATLERTGARLLARLTPLGEDKLRRVAPAWEIAQRRVHDALGDELASILARQPAY